MNQTGFLLLNGNQINELLTGKEEAILTAVKTAYVVHRGQDSCLPHSSFIRFPNKEKERIIALPAYLGGSFKIAGIKWIASFPGNLDLGMERASAQLTLNSPDTGYPVAYMESSIISAKRTAASAAAAADALRDSLPVRTVGLVGCGLINYETLRFLLAARPELDTVKVFDLSDERAAQFIGKSSELSDQLVFQKAAKMEDVFANCDVVALATTAVNPFIDNLDGCDKSTVILHTSLRDIKPNVILEADNLIDDFEHALRARTSLHLAEMEVGHRDFVRCEIADVFTGEQAPRPLPDKHRIFSPFGLGVLDLAVATIVMNEAKRQGVGTMIDDFLPKPWFER